MTKKCIVGYQDQSAMFATAGDACVAAQWVADNSDIEVKAYFDDSDGVWKIMSAIYGEPPTDREINERIAREGRDAILFSNGRSEEAKKFHEDHEVVGPLTFSSRKFVPRLGKKGKEKRPFKWTHEMYPTEPIEDDDKNLDDAFGGLGMPF